MRTKHAFKRGINLIPEDLLETVGNETQANKHVKKWLEGSKIEFHYHISILYSSFVDFKDKIAEFF